VVIQGENRERMVGVLENSSPNDLCKRRDQGTTDSLRLGWLMGECPQSKRREPESNTQGKSNLKTQRNSSQSTLR